MQGVAHLEEFVGVEHTKPLVFLGMVFDAAFHNMRLKALAVSSGDGLGFDVGEIKDRGRHVIGRLNRMGGEGRFGAVVVEVKVPDAMVVVVMS